MKAKPMKLGPAGQFEPCAPAEATHVTIKMPGPTGRLTLPVVLGNATRGGTGAGPWTWNEDIDRPTLKPSILLTSGHFAEGFRKADPTERCWCDYNREHPEDSQHFHCHRCHTWIGEGKAQFLDDCSHELKGQTVELLEVD